MGGNKKKHGNKFKQRGGGAGTSQSRPRRGRRRGPPKSQRSLPHPRSLYKSGFTDIKGLAASFPELMEYTIEQKEGKVKIDFNDKKSLSVLTRAIVKRDFGLDLVLPYNKMVPFVQMRHNYLLWMEDLLDMWPPGTNSNFIYGIDIGANASCLYALIAAKKNSWYMLTSEYDNEIYNVAQQNVKMNNLQNLVTVKKVDEMTFLEGLVDPDVPYYDFCMFSPPVFRNKDGQTLMGRGNDGQFSSVSKLTGRAGDVLSGGEANLMRNIVAESVKFGSKIKIFSFMAGRQSTVDKLGPELVELVGDDYVASQVFCYGPNHTYGVAWTFDKNVKIKNETRLKFHDRNTKPAIEFTVQASLDDAFSRIIAILEKFMVNYTVLERTDMQYSMEINTYYTFWNEKERKKALNWRHEMESSYGPDWKRRKLEGGQMIRALPYNSSSSDSSVTFFPPNTGLDRMSECSDSRNHSKKFHTGRTLIVAAKLGIVQVDTSHVSIEFLPTSGVAGKNGVRIMCGFLRDEWYRNTS